MTQERPKIPRNVIIVAWVALASGFGQDLITPVLPAYLALLGFSRANIGLIDGLLQGATNIFRFISGILSDRFKNRKFFVFLGYTLSSLARPLLALANSFASIAGLRVIDGVGKGMKDAPRDALVADSVTAATHGRAFGFHRLIDTAGSVFGPLLATALLVYFTPSLQTYRGIFLLTTLTGAVALLLIWLGIKEPARAARVLPQAGQKLSGLFWLFTLGTSLAMLTKINDSLFLLRGGDLGIPRMWIPLVFAGFTLIYALLSYPIGIWSDRVGKLPFIAAGWLLLALVELGFSRVSSVPVALLLFALYGVFFALTEGSGRALIADLVAKEARGSAYAIYYTATGLALIAGGFGLGRVWDLVSPRAAFEIAATGSITSFLLFLMIQIKKKAAS